MMNSRPTKKPKAPRGPFKEMRKGMSRLMEGKPFLIAVSLLASIFIWGVLVASDGTLTREKTFSNVALSVTGEASLKSRGYIVTDDLDALLPGVRMTVEVAQANYNRVSGTSYNPHLDLTQVKGEGANEIKVSYSSQLYGPVLECEPSSFTVNVERFITRRVPVVLEIEGETPGYYLDSVRTDPTTLSVSGPQSQVSKVSRVVATLDASKLSGERPIDKTAVDISLQNVMGETLEQGMIEITNQSVITSSIIVETEIVPMKDIPLDVSTFVTGEPAEGYELVAVEPAVSSVAIAAKGDVLDAMTIITTESPLNIEGATKDVSGYVRLKKPSGIENSTPYDVAVKAKIKETTTERMLRQVPVEIDGLNDNMRATVSKSNQTVQISGGYTFIQSLDKADVRLFVDVSGLGEGEYQVPVQISIDNAPEFICALSSPEITVTISAR